MSKRDDGGPAFSRSCSEDRTMGTLPDGDKTVDEQDGMSLRDYFAGQALVVSGVIAGALAFKGGCTVNPVEVSERAYQLADAMLAERNKQT